MEQSYFTDSQKLMAFDEIILAFLLSSQIGEPDIYSFMYDRMDEFIGDFIERYPEYRRLWI